MTADDLIKVATAMRALGARELTIGGELSVKFDPPRIDYERAADLPDENGLLNDRKKVSPERLEQLRDAADHEYIP